MEKFDIGHSVFDIRYYPRFREPNLTYELLSFEKDLSNSFC
jgi:hypothetical protein